MFILRIMPMTCNCFPASDMRNGSYEWILPSAGGCAVPHWRLAKSTCSTQLLLTGTCGLVRASCLLKLPSCYLLARRYMDGGAPQFIHFRQYSKPKGCASAKGGHQQMCHSIFDKLCYLILSLIGARNVLGSFWSIWSPHGRSGPL